MEPLPDRDLEENNGTTTGKHVNNTRAIARQLLCKWNPAATVMYAAVEVLLGYNNGKDIFYVVRAEML
jgi:hypothetical protein